MTDLNPLGNPQINSQTNPQINPLTDPGETPEDVATLYSWANLHGAKYRDFSASRAQTREKARLRAEQAMEEARRASAADLGRGAEAQFALDEAKAAEAAHVAAQAANREPGPIRLTAGESIDAEAEVASKNAAEQARLAGEEQARAEQVRAEQVRAEQVKADETRADEARAEAVRLEQARIEQAQAEEIRAQEIKAEELRVEQARLEKIKAEELAAQQAAEAQAKLEAEQAAHQAAVEHAAQVAAEVAKEHAAQMAATSAALAAAQEAERLARVEAARRAQEWAEIQAGIEAAKHAQEQAALKAAKEAEERQAALVAAAEARKQAELEAARHAEEQAALQARAAKEAEELAERERAEKEAAAQAEAEREKAEQEKAEQELAAQKLAAEELAAREEAEQILAAEKLAAEEKEAAERTAHVKLVEELAATERVASERPWPKPDRFPVHSSPIAADAIHEGQMFAAQQATKTEETSMPGHAPWATHDSQEASGRPAWLNSDKPEVPKQKTASATTEDESLQSSRDRMTSRWFALRGIFDGAPTPIEPTPQPVVSRAPAMAVFSLAGGVGKTSLVATLGRALSARGERVLLVDTAAFGLLPFFFGATDQRPGVLRTFNAPGLSNDAPIQIVTIDPEDLEGEAGSHESLSGEIGKYSRGAGRVIVDLATASGATTRRIMRMSPLVLVPVVADMNSVVSVSSIDAFFEHNSNATGKPIMPYYLLNQFDASLPLHLDVREVLREQLGDRLLPFAMRRTPAMSEALAEGMTVIDYAPGSPLAEDFSTLAGWVKSLSAPATASYRGVRWSER